MNSRYPGHHPCVSHCAWVDGLGYGQQENKVCLFGLVLLIVFMTPATL